ncbi:DUF4880 domain-containing protein [Pseudomonas sp. Marseille-QA0892]
MSDDHRVLREAAQWFALLASGQSSEGDRDAWQRWLAKPDHAQAWQRVEQISGQMRHLAGGNTEAANRALSRQGTGRRHAIKALGVMLGGGALALSTGGDLFWQRLQADARTAVGEMRHLELPGGLSAWLNSDSAVAFPNEHTVRLLRGEVALQTTEAAPPLSLKTAAGQMTLAPGSRCSLRELPHDSLQLSVYQGSARLDPPHPEIINAGRGARIAASRVEARFAADMAREAWINGTLLAEDRALGDVLEDVARYRHGYLGYDPDVAALRVVGAFPLKDTDLILDALAATLPVRIHRLLPWWVSVKPA